MFTIIEIILSYVLQFTLHKFEKLNTTERQIVARLGMYNSSKRKSEKPKILAMVGLTGSGKSTVAKICAEEFVLSLINNDSIRSGLNEWSQDCTNLRVIYEETAIKILKDGGNVVLDSDFVSILKRASLRAKARKVGAKIIYVRVFCDIDTVIGRIMKADYSAMSIFTTAKSLWSGERKGSVIKIREMWRRTPHHYKWTNDRSGGKWVLKNLHFKTHCNINTTYAKENVLYPSVGEDKLRQALA